MHALVSALRARTLFAAALCSLASFALLAPAPALAGWPLHPDDGGLPLCTAADYQWYAQAIEDGSGGLFVTWRDDRGRTVSLPNNYDVYAQHVSAAGVPLWGANGVAVCTDLGTQDRPALCSDGAGGVYVAWSDGRTGNNDVWAQHLNAAGAPQWLANGLRAARLDAANDYAPALVSDGAGGFLTVWYSYDAATGTRLRAQRMNAAGFQLWGTTGVAIGGPAGNQTDPRVLEDGTGGMVLSWVQGSTPRSVRAQRVSGAGTTQWGATGVAVTDTTRAASRTHYLVPNLAGGARFLVHDTAIVPTPWYRDLDGTGASVRWAQVLPATAWSEIMTGACAGDSGATLVSTTNGGFESVQRIAADGTLDWGPHGQPVSPDTLGRTMYLTLARDGAGGAYLVGTAVDTTTHFYEVRAQHVRWDRSLAWDDEGRTFASAVTGDQQAPQAFATDRGVIALWQDYRTVATTGLDLYAQRMDSTGTPGVPVLDAPAPGRADVFALAAPWPNPARSGAAVTLRFALPAASHVSLALHDVAGRRVRVLADGSFAAGEHRVRIEDGETLSPGLYFARLTTPQGVALTRRIAIVR
jgi:hypothetical protein